MTKARHNYDKGKPPESGNGATNDVLLCTVRHPHSFLLQQPCISCDFHKSFVYLQSKWWVFKFCIRKYLYSAKHAKRVSYQHNNRMESRQDEIVKTGYIGVATNIVVAGGKVLQGEAPHNAP